MTKAELESKHLAELHSLAAEVGVPGYRMLVRAELIEKLLAQQPKSEPKPKPKPEPRREPARRRPRGREERPQERRERPRSPETAEAAPPTPAGEAAPARPRRRRRRRFRRRRGVRVHDLLLPPTPGRQTIVYAESRAACTALLREVAAELSDASKGPDPVALLVDPSPEELADWKREAPQVEIVAAGQARHVDDALAQATLRANGGEDVIVLVDSLSRFVEAYGDADAARELFEAGRDAGRAGNGSLTVVVAVERPS